MSKKEKSMGMRLREERERLGFNQDDFGEIGGVKRRTQIKYEQGVNAPDIFYMEKISQRGADIRYVQSGLRTKKPGEVEEDPATYGMTPDERAMHYMSLVIDLQHELGLNLTAAQIKTLIGYAYEHAPTKDSLQAFIENAIAFVAGGSGE